jgi:uncharacterized membrane protein
MGGDLVSTPSPTPIDSATALTAGAELIAILALIGLVGFILVWALIKVSSREPSAMVTITLGLLTLVAMGGFILTQSDILGTIAATGIGALAGAVTNLFDSKKRGTQDSEADTSGPAPSDPSSGSVG